MSVYARRTSVKTLTAISALVGLAAGALWVAVAGGAVADAQAAGDDEATQSSELDDDDAALDGVVAATSLRDLPTLESLTLGRDPFATVRPPAPEDTQPASTEGSNTGGTGGDSDDDANGGGQDTDDDGACRSNGESVCDGVVVVVVEVRDGEAVIQVDGDRYTVAEGDTFAEGRFQLLRLEAGCARMVYLDGDVAEVFDQCPGATTLK